MDEHEELPGEIETLGEAIRCLREKRGMSLRGLAREVEVTAPFLSDVEHGRRKPKPERLCDIAGALGVEPEVLTNFDPRVPKDVSDWIEANPALVKLLQDMKNSGRSVVELRRAFDESKERDSARGELAAATRAEHATQNELDALRATVTENVSTMADTIKERDHALEGLDRLERFIEGLDLVGHQLARHEGHPYDRYTCWGEAACDVSSRIEKLVKERDDFAAKLKTRDEQIIWLVEFCEALPRSTPDELRDWIAKAKDEVSPDDKN